MAVKDPTNYNIVQKLVDDSSYLSFFYRGVINKSISSSGVYNTENPKAKKVKFLRLTVGSPQGIKYSENTQYTTLPYVDGRIYNRYQNITGSPSVASKQSTVKFDNIGYITNSRGVMDDAYFSNGTVKINSINRDATAPFNPYLEFTIDQANMSTWTDFSNAALKAGDYIQITSDAGSNTLSWVQTVQVVNDCHVVQSGNVYYLNDNGGTNNNVYVNRDQVESGTYLAPYNCIKGDQVAFAFIVRQAPSYAILPYDILQFDGDFVLEEITLVTG